MQAWFTSLPLFTKSVLTLCLSIYLVEALVRDVDTTGLCLSENATFARFQLYRIFTSVVIHNGILHLAFNMLAFVPMGQQLERLIGTVYFGCDYHRNSITVIYGFLPTHHATQTDALQVMFLKTYFRYCFCPKNTTECGQVRESVLRCPRHRQCFAKTGLKPS